jgi:hypothetical protein
MIPRVRTRGNGIAAKRKGNDRDAVPTVPHGMESVPSSMESTPRSMESARRSMATLVKSPRHIE